MLLTIFNNSSCAFWLKNPPCRFADEVLGHRHRCFGLFEGGSFGTRLEWEPGIYWNHIYHSDSCVQQVESIISTIKKCLFQSPFQNDKAASDFSTTEKSFVFFNHCLFHVCFEAMRDHFGNKKIAWWADYYKLECRGLHNGERKK